MVHEIDENYFLEIIEDTSKFQYKREYVKDGFIIYKEKNEDNYYIQADGHTILIDNLNDFNLFLKDYKKFIPSPKQYKVESIFYNKNPYKKIFPQFAFQCIDQLTVETGVQLSLKSGLTLKSLHEIDVFLNSKGRNIKFREKNFMNIVALCGEALNQKYKNICNWSMTLDDDTVTWEADILYNDHPLSLGVRLYENLCDLQVEDPLIKTISTIDLIIGMNIKK